MSNTNKQNETGGHSSISGDAKSESDDFIVDKILAKRMNQIGITEYAVKGEGHHITWKPAHKLEDYKALLKKFEQETKKTTIVCERLTGSANGSEENPNAANAAGSDDNNPIEGEGADKTDNCSGKEQGPDMCIKTKFEKDLTPERIIGATLRNGELLFLIKWKNQNKANLVRAKDANIMWPQVVIQYYEFHLVLDHSAQ